MNFVPVSKETYHTAKEPYYGITWRKSPITISYSRRALLHPLLVPDGCVPQVPKETYHTAKETYHTAKETYHTAKEPY